MLWINIDVFGCLWGFPSVTYIFTDGMWHSTCFFNKLKSKDKDLKTAFITWNGRIAPVFDVAVEATIIEHENQNVVSRQNMSLPESNPMDKIIALAEAGISTIVCGAISNPFRHQAVAYDITVHAFISGELENVVKAWKDDKLDQIAFAMPGCGMGRKQGRGWGNGGRGQGKGRGSYHWFNR